MSIMRTKLLSISFIIILIMSNGTLSLVLTNMLGNQSQTKSETSIDIMKLGEDKTISNTVTILDEILNNNEISIHNDHRFDLTTNANILIIIGHGNDEGIQLNNELISWEKLATILDPTQKTYIAACNSEKLRNYLGDTSNIKMFTGDIDSILAAGWIGIQISKDIADKEGFSLAYNILVKRYVDIFVNGIKADTLRIDEGDGGNTKPADQMTESGYQLAVRKEYRCYAGCLFTQNVLWFNFAPWMQSGLLVILSGVSSAISGSVIGWLAGVLAFAGSLATALATSIFFAAVIAIGLLIIWNAHERYYHDNYLGIAAGFPLPEFSAFVDNEDPQNYQNEDVLEIPIPDPSFGIGATAVYFAFGLVSPNWSDNVIMR